MIRRLTLSTLVAVAGLAVLASSAAAKGGPRLNGSFDVVATIHANDFGVPDGTTTNDIYKFKSTCKSGGCKTVDLDRDGGDGSHYKSTLSRTEPGVYDGVEGPEPYACIGNDEATFTAEHHIEVTKAKRGKAKKIGGTTEISISGCGGLTFVDYTLAGKRS